MINRLPGMQDIVDCRLSVRLTTLLRDYLIHASYVEVATPLIESTELFKRSLGESTDVVHKELYFVHSAHATPDQCAQLSLRPEATASIMRAYLNNHITQTPWQAFTIGPMFRHERHQKGRYRQFSQASIEAIGIDSVAYDAYFILILERLFAETLAMTDYALLINFMGCGSDRARYVDMLRPYGMAHTDALCSTCAERLTNNPLRILDCKQERCQRVYDSAPTIAESLCSPCQAEWEQLQLLLQQLSVSYSHAPRLVRGLDYYEKTVFEFVSLVTNGEGALGSQTTFCGGGRYRRLAQALGAREDVPAIGAGIGMERLLMLTERHLAANGPKELPLYGIIPTTVAQQGSALQLYDRLRLATNYRVEPLLAGASLKSMFRAANKRGIQRLLVIGPDEQKKGVVLVKDMATGAEESIATVLVERYLFNAAIQE